MRTIAEIKADITRCQKCKEQISRDCLLSNCQDCSYIHFANLKDLRMEFLQALTSDIPLDDLETLCQAWREGRLVMLPCKVGEPVYAIANCADVIKLYDDDYFTGTGAISCPFEKDCPFEECDDGNRRVFETACKGFWVDDEGRLSVFLDYINTNIGPLNFGKTVFLTREAAEAALKEGVR